MAWSQERRPLQRYRRGAMLTIRDLAQRAGVSTSTVVAIEQGHKTPRFATMQKIAAALGVDPLAVQEFADVVEGDQMGKAAARGSLAAA